MILLISSTLFGYLRYFSVIMYMLQNMPVNQLINLNVSEQQLSQYQYAMGMIFHLE